MIKFFKEYGGCLVMIVLFCCGGIVLTMINSNKSEEHVVHNVKTQISHKTKDTPKWIPFETYLENRNGYIYTSIKTSDEAYIVWVNYEWADSTKISEGSKNIVSNTDCYSFDYAFLKIGSVAHYDYLKSGKAINTIEHEQPDWSYIIPGTEGENIAHEVVQILEKRYTFNQAANRIYRTRNDAY